jgi:hypothetical protein
VSHVPWSTAVGLTLHTLQFCVQVIKNKIRGVNMKGFGYGGEDAYFYASAQ